MNLEEVAKKLGYLDVEHLENNIESYGEPLLEWWEVIKEFANTPADSELKNMNENGK